MNNYSNKDNILNSFSENETEKVTQKKEINPNNSNDKDLMRRKKVIIDNSDNIPNGKNESGLSQLERIKKAGINHVPATEFLVKQNSLEKQKVNTELVTETKNPLINTKLKKALTFLGGLALAGGSAYLAYKFLNNQYLFLKEQNITIELIPEEVTVKLLEWEEKFSFKKRLKYAKDELQRNHDLATDSAGLIAFSTLEHFLRAMCEKCKLKFDKKNRPTIMNMLKKLRSITAITREDYDSIKDYTYNIRNKLAHGYIYMKEKVRDAVSYISSFIEMYAGFCGIEFA